MDCLHPEYRRRGANPYTALAAAEAADQASLSILPRGATLRRIKGRLSSIAVRIAPLIPPRVRLFLRRRPVIWRLVSRLRPLLLTHDQPIVMELKKGPLAGHKLAVSESSMRYFWLGGHDEPAVVEALAACVKPGDAALDIGAHIGVETLLLASKVGPDGVVVSVEPDPRNVALLRTNCALNELHNVRIVEGVVSNSAGEVDFLLDSDSTRSHIAFGQAQEDTRTVRSWTVDQLIHEKCGARRVGVIKIDVEGHEADVLDGARETLSARRSSLILEVHTGRALRACRDLLRSYGFDLSTLGENEELEARLEAPAPATERFPRGHVIARPT